MHIHGTDIAAVFISPDGVQKIFTGVNAVGIAHQEFNHVKFLRGQIRKDTASVCVSGIQIQRDGTDGQKIACDLLFLCSGSAKKRTDAGFQFQNIKGLCKIIVCSGIKAVNFIFNFTFCSDKG